MENTDLTNENLLGDEYSEVSGRKERRKKKKIARLKAKGKTTKADRVAGRLQRALARKAKRAKGIALTPDELDDEALDSEEAKDDGSVAESANLTNDALKNGNADLTTDVTDTTGDTSKTASDGSDTILGMPKVAFYVGLGLVVLVGGFVAYKMITKKAVKA